MINMVFATIEICGSVSSCCRKKDVPQNGLRALNNGVTLFCRAGNAAA